MRKWIALLCLPAFALLSAACDNVAPTPTPIRPLSAPTLEASATILPLMPALAPTQYLYAGQNDPTAASLPRDSELPPLAAGTLVPGATHQAIQVTAPDGTQLTGNLYASPAGSQSPGILLLSADSSVWRTLPESLQNKGFTALVMPLRPGALVNSAASLGDFEAMIEAMGQVADPGHLAVVGSQSGADLALAGCAAEPLCKALVLLSPSDQEIAQNTITRYNPRPIFLSVAQNDPNFGLVEYLRGSARGEVGYAAVDGSAQGAALLQADPTLGDQIITWLASELNS